MKFGLTLILALLLTVTGTKGESPDRQSRHEQRMAGLNLVNRSLYASPGRSVQTLSAGLDASVVSESVAPASFSQDKSRLVPLADQGWLAVWQDNRQGVSKIYGQELDSLGQPAGANQLLAGSSVGASYVEPCLAVDNQGRVNLSYRDQTNGLIYVTRFDSDLQENLPPFLVNDTSQSSFAGPQDMAVFPDGTLVVVWENYSVLGSTIQFRLYSPSGASLVGPQIVNSDGGSSNHWVPVVAVAPTSGYLIAWEDYRNGRADIFVRQFSGNGTAVGTEFSLVPPPSNASNQFHPTLAWSSKDQYVIGWEDRRSGQEIYLQRYHPTLGLQGGNALISSGQPQVQNADLQLTASGSDRLSAIWSATGADNTIQHLELDSGLVPAALPKVMNLASLGQRWEPCLMVNGRGDRGVVWSELTSRHPDISFMQFDQNGTRLLANELILNDDAIGAPSTRPAMATTDDWLTLVTFVDGRFDGGDIFIRALLNDGRTTGPERKLNQDSTGGVQTEPSLTSTSNGALATWIDSRTVSGSSGLRIFGRYCDESGLPSGPEFLISDSTATGLKSNVTAAALTGGEALVVWIDRRQTTAQVYGRLVDGSGTVSSNDILISNPATDSSAGYLAVAVDNSNRYYVLWLDLGKAERTVKGRRFDNSLNQLDVIDWSSSVSAVEINELAAGVQPDGTISLAWSGFQNGGKKLFLTQLSGDGTTVVTAPTEISDDLSANVSAPSLNVSPIGYLSFAWIDSRDGQAVAYYQVLNAALMPIGGNQPICNVTPELMKEVTTTTRNGRVWFAWSDNRNNGFNIYAATDIFEPTDTEDDDPPALPLSFVLNQNYPNPFNPSTTISFELPKAGQVSVQVFNSLGQKVRTLIASKQLPAGQHEVVWDGQDEQGRILASGTYFYRVKVGDQTATRKMLLLK